MSAPTIIMALLMGLTGSLHCAGMCGPIVWIMPFQSLKGFRKIAAITLYHTGRISVYACMALLLHSFRNLFDPRIQQYVSILCGVALLCAGIVYFLPAHTNVKLPWSNMVQRQLNRVAGNPAIGALTAAGMLNGLLPCGLVYMALSASMQGANAAQAMGLMYFFGLGTLPMLISITILKGKTHFLRGENIRRMAPVIVFSFGCLFVLRGMNLGIPYLSPKVEITHQGLHSCCCHKSAIRL